MKKKILVGVTTVLVSAFAAYGVSKSMKNSNTELRELTLANIEALAQSEEDGSNLGCGNNNFDNHILKLKDCFPFFWLQKLKCKPMQGKCCDSESQRSCSGQNPGIDLGL